MKTTTPALFAVATLAAILASPAKSSPLLSTPKISEPLVMLVPGPVDVMVSKKPNRGEVGDNIYVNFTTTQSILQRVKRQTATSYFRLENDFFERRMDAPPIPYMYMNATTSTPSLLTATRGNRNFRVSYQSLSGDGNITADLIRSGYDANITTESDILIRQNIKPTRQARYRNARFTTTLTSSHHPRYGFDRDRDSDELTPQDGASVRVLKKGDKKPKPRRSGPRRPRDLFE